MNIVSAFKKNEALRIVFPVLLLLLNILLLIMFQQVVFFVSLAAIIFYITIIRPFVGLTAAFAIELSLKNYHLGPSSIRTVILLLIILYFFWKEVMAKKKISHLFLYLRDPVIRIGLLFFLWQIITNGLVHKSFNPNQALRIAMGICLLVLSVYFLKDIKKIEAVLYAGFITLFLSSLIAILQKHVGEPFISLPNFLGEIDAEWQKFFVLIEKRYSGFTESNLRLAYDIVNVFPFLLALSLFNSGLQKILHWKKIPLYIMSIFILYALILTGTRSSFFGILIGMAISMAVLAGKQKRTFFEIGKKLLTVALIIIIFALALNVSKIRSFRRVMRVYEQHSAGAKIPKFISGLKASQDALLFGIGRIWVDPLTNEEEIPKFLRRYSTGLGGGNVHNIFLNNLLLGGVPRLILLIFFFIAIIINIYYLFLNALSQGELKKYWPFFFGLSIWISAYIIDKFTHNADPFNYDFLFWFVLGILAALTAILKKEIPAYPASKA